MTFWVKDVLFEAEEVAEGNGNRGATRGAESVLFARRIDVSEPEVVTSFESEGVATFNTKFATETCCDAVVKFVFDFHRHLFGGTVGEGEVGDLCRVGIVKVR